MFIIGVLLSYFAVLSKPNALSSLFFIPFLWLITSDKKNSEIVKLSGIWIIAHIPIILWVVYGLKTAIGIGTSVINTPILERILRSFNLMGIHLSHIAWPWPISLGYPYDYQWHLNIYFIIGVFFVLATIILFFIKQKSLITLGFILFVIYLLPALQIFPEVQNAHIFDRYLAIPLIGIFIILVSIISKITAFWQKRKSLIIALLSLICVSWGTVTVNYIPTFKNNVAYSAHLYKLYPNWMGAVSTAYNYTNTLIIDGQFDKAEKLILSDQCLNRYDWINEYLLGSVYFGKKDYDKAYNYLYSSSIKAMKAGYYPRAKLLLTDILIMRGQYADAKYLLNSLLTEKYNSPNDLNKISVLLKHIETLERH